MPESYLALSAICYNEVCQKHHFDKAMVRVTPFQRVTRHILTWSGTKFFYRPMYGNISPSAVAFAEKIIKDSIPQGKAK
jgi:hypothetical protein